VVGGLYSPQVVSRVARVRPTVTRRKDPGRGLRDSGRADCAATYDDANRSPEFGSSYSSAVRYRARTLRRRPRRASTSFTPTATGPDTSFSTRGSGQVDFYDEGSRWTGYAPATSPRARSSDPTPTGDGTSRRRCRSRPMAAG